MITLTENIASATTKVTSNGIQGNYNPTTTSSTVPGDEDVKVVV